MGVRGRREWGRRGEKGRGVCMWDGGRGGGGYSIEAKGLVNIFFFFFFTASYQQGYGEEKKKQINLTASKFEAVPLVEFMYRAFTRIPGESYRRRHRSLLLSLCDVFRALVNSLACCF